MDRRRDYVLQTLASYWPDKAETILNLPIPQVNYKDLSTYPPEVTRVPLPPWATDIGIQNYLLVPSQALTPGEKPVWSRIDWLSTVFWYLNGLAERAFETENGPIHSYSSRLRDWDSQLWERAWVNRTALFLRRWAAHQRGTSEEALFGPLPKAKILLTHDVDAITKTVAIRLKQSAFHTFNAFRNLQPDQFKRAIEKTQQAIKVLFSRDKYWCFEQITSLEEVYQQRSHFNIYGGLGGWSRTPQQLLMDPGYQANDPKLKTLLRQLQAAGWVIGLHQSFGAWADAERMAQERVRLEQILDAPVITCRQHWLRFSWDQTWIAQQTAGIRLDTTLGFNDRPAFRNGAALRFQPWDNNAQQPMNMEILPLVLMDSHLYDYHDLSEIERKQQLTYWFEEICAVHGQATVVWHQRVWAADYGWDQSYIQLLEMMQKKGMKTKYQTDFH